MKKKLGIVLAAVILGVIAFFLYLFLQNNSDIITPIPQNDRVKVIPL